MATTNDLKNGTVLKIDGQLWTVVEFQHVKPGKGGAFVRTKLKNVLSGKVVDKTFNAGLKVETANVDKRDMQYLYKDGNDYVFMDTDTYDQLHVSETTVGDAANFLLENQNAMVATNEGVPLYVELPPSVVLEITYTEPGLQGDRSTGGTKPATLETGHQIQVPLFLETGTKVKVDTRDSSYLGRVNDYVGARSMARTRALDVLFAAEQRQRDPLTLLGERIAEPGTEASLPQYSVDIVEGVLAEQARIDELLSTHAHGWTLERMPAVDRAVLRIGTWEILYNDDVPDAVAVDEAVELARALSTDDSPTFVNGLLGRIVDLKPTILA